MAGHDTRAEYRREAVPSGQGALALAIEVGGEGFQPVAEIGGRHLRQRRLGPHAHFGVGIGRGGRQGVARHDAGFDQLPAGPLANGEPLAAELVNPAGDLIGLGGVAGRGAFVGRSRQNEQGQGDGQAAACGASQICQAEGVCHGEVNALFSALAATQPF